MTGKQKQRYVFAIYSGLGVLGIAVALLGALLNEGTIQSLLLNLSTELFGAVLLFVILNWFFMLDSEQSLTERIGSILTILEREYSVLLDSKKSREILDFEERLNSSKQIDLLGYSLYKLLSRNSKSLIEVINKSKTKIRMILIDPKSMAAQVVSAQTAGDRYLEQCDLSFKTLTFMKKNIIPNAEGSLDIRLIRFIPSCVMIILDRDDNEQGMINVKIKAPYGSPPRLARRNFILKKRKDSDDFETWLEQFESCWQDGQPWNPAKS